MGSSLNLYQAQARASAYYSLDSELALRAGRARAMSGSEFGSDLDEIPANWRFEAGGGGSVRGYAYDTLGPTAPNGDVIGGRSVFDGSAELRVKVTDTLGFVPFVDAGNAFAASAPDFSQPLHWAAGIGLRYYTCDRTDPARHRDADRQAARRPPGRGLRQHRTVVLTARRSRAWKLGAFVAAMLALVLAGFAAALADNDDKGIVASFISSALSSKTSKVSIGAVDGALSSDVTIHDVVLSDRDGTWLKIDTIKLVWSRTALFQRRLEINQLAIDHLDILRKPVAPPPDPEGAQARRERASARPAAESGRPGVLAEDARPRRADPRREGQPFDFTARRRSGRPRKGSTFASMRIASTPPGNSSRGSASCPNRPSFRSRSISTSRRTASWRMRRTFPACRRSS